MAASAASLLTRGGNILLFSPVTARRCNTVAAVRTYSHSCLHWPGLPNSSSLSLRGARRLCCLSQPSEQTAVADTAEAGPPPTSADSVPSPQEQESAVKAAAGLLDIRVGRVLRAWLHPEADSLYVEEVDVGEPEPRTICSGLVKYVPLDQLQGKSVVVLANLKPRNMRGVKSNGMLMAASDAAHENVELLLLPDGSVPGERIWFGSEEDKDGQPEAATPNQDLHTKMRIGSGYKRPDGIYYLDLPKTPAALLSTAVTVEQWHYRLGHLSSEKLRHLFPCIATPVFQCEAC